jgi:hypothetical protein
MPLGHPLTIADHCYTVYGERRTLMGMGCVFDHLLRLFLFAHTVRHLLLVPAVSGIGRGEVKSEVKNREYSVECRLLLESGVAIACWPRPSRYDDRSKLSPSLFFAIIRSFCFFATCWVLALLLPFFFYIWYSPSSFLLFSSSF